MKSFYRLENPIRDYAWGHPEYIPDLLGLDYPEGHPAAELWMGAHPGAPSKIMDGSEAVNLNRFIEQHPEKVLGSGVWNCYGGLPFLFKLLAAGKSLSIQAHPDKEMAEKGFAAENARGVPKDSPERNYKDDNHKPEIIMALTPFTAMIGFRQPESVGRVFSALQASAAVQLVPAEVLERLLDGDANALRNFLVSLLTATEDDVRLVLKNAWEKPGSDWSALQVKWVKRLTDQFPGDPGALAPLFLNVVEIAPGEGLYQPARVLHAYLEGFGLELMANSDNVLRGGLTPKNVDVPELTKVLDFNPRSPEILKPSARDGLLRKFETPAAEFELNVADFGGSDTLQLPAGFGPAIALVLDGRLMVRAEDDETRLKRGESIFLPAAGGVLSFSGQGRLALATVGR